MKKIIHKNFNFKIYNNSWYLYFKISVKFNSNDKIIHKVIKRTTIFSKMKTTNTRQQNVKHIVKPFNMIRLTTN